MSHDLSTMKPNETSLMNKIPRVSVINFRTFVGKKVTSLYLFNSIHPFSFITLRLVLIVQIGLKPIDHKQIFGDRDLKLVRK